jgi:four helix bundle protein
MNDQAPSPKQDSAPYDLQERTAVFGENVIALAKRVPANAVNVPMITQIVRSGTSVVANYCEADDADSKKDFRHKIGIARREAKETKHWLRMIASAEPSLKDGARQLWREAHELVLILAKIGRSSK